MRLNGGTIWFELAPSLVDEVLTAASRMAPEALRRQYLEERDAVATIEIVDIREESFRDLDAHWMERFGVADALRSVLDESHPLSARVAGCVLSRARHPVEERARLEARGEGLPVLAVSLRAETLLSPSRLRDLLETVA
jgi:hypothetical protein